jgi:hypothetical protein
LAALFPLKLYTVLAIVLISAKMNRNKLFSRTRTQLALSYAIVMGVILSLLGLGVYRAIVHAHIITVDRELKSVAGTLHDSLEWKLKQPGRIEPIVQNILPNLCLAGVNCSQERVNDQRPSLSALNQSDYYIRLFNHSGQLVAMTNTFPDGLPQRFNPDPWQTLSDSNGNSYHQILIALHTQDQQNWGYLQVGRSLQDVNDYLNSVKLILGLGLPIAIILVAAQVWD